MNMSKTLWRSQPFNHRIANHGVSADLGPSLHRAWAWAILAPSNSWTVLYSEAGSEGVGESLVGS